MNMNCCISGQVATSNSAYEDLCTVLIADYVFSLPGHKRVKQVLLV